MSLESPRDLRFEGANAPEDRRPRAPNGSTDFAEIPYSTLKMCSSAQLANPQWEPYRSLRWASPGCAQEHILSVLYRISAKSVLPLGARGRRSSGAFAPSKRRSRGDSSDILVVLLGYLLICRAVSRF